MFCQTKQARIICEYFLFESSIQRIQRERTNREDEDVNKYILFSSPLLFRLKSGRLLQIDAACLHSVGKLPTHRFVCEFAHTIPIPSSSFQHRNAAPKRCASNIFISTTYSILYIWNAVIKRISYSRFKVIVIAMLLELVCANVATRGVHHASQIVHECVACATVCQFSSLPVEWYFHKGVFARATSLSASGSCTWFLGVYGGGRRMT